MMAALRGQCACGFVDGLWLEGLSTRLREMQTMVQERASFVYANNDQMTSEVKDALAGFDQDKTGRVSTSELVAGAKALQEVRPRGRERLVGVRNRAGSDVSGECLEEGSLVTDVGMERLVACGAFAIAVFESWRAVPH